MDQQQQQPGQQQMPQGNGQGGNGPYAGEAGNTNLQQFAGYPALMQQYFQVRYLAALYNLFAKTHR